MKSTLFILLATTAFASAETAENLLDQLRTAASAEAREAREATDAVHQQRAFQWQELLTQLDRQAGSEGSSAELLGTLHAMEAAAGSEKLATLCHTIATQLRDEQEKRDSALADEMEKAFSEALRSALAARSTKDVDAPLASVHQYIQRPRVDPYGSGNSKLQKLANQGQQLWQFLRQWQDLLAGVDTDGGSTTPEQRLQRLLNSNSDFTNLMPRSEMLEKLTGKKPAAEKKWTQEEMDKRAREILAATHTLDDMPDSIRQLQELMAEKHGPFFSQVAMNGLQLLNNLDRVRRDLDKGLSTTMSLNTVYLNNNTEIDRLLSPVREQLLLYALPRLLNAGDADKPRANETVPNYLRRMATSARERADWNTLQRAIELMQSFNIERTAASNDHTALQSFLAGLNQERAKQFMFAVISYEAALKAGSQIISAELVGEHLERIRKEHPDEYEQGVQAAVGATSAPSIPPAADPRPGRPRP